MLELGVYKAKQGRRFYVVTSVGMQTNQYTVTTVPGGGELVLTEEELTELIRQPAIPSIKQSKIYLSASQINTFRACPRKWAWTYIDGIKPPPNKNMAFGLEVHTAIEYYQKNGIWTGKTDAMQCAQQGQHVLPAPKSKEVGIEYRFEIPLFDTTIIVGVIDIIVAKPGLIEVIDHKTTKELRYAKQPADLREDVQANIYAKWALDTYRVQPILTKWLYYAARLSRSKTAVDGRPRIPGGFRAITRAKTAEEINEQWESILTTTKEMVAIYSDLTITAKNVKCNTWACEDYGGCPFKDICTPDSQSLGELIGSHSQKGSANVSSLMDIIRRNKEKQTNNESQPKAETTPPKPVPSQQDILKSLGVNPPPIEQQPLDPELEEATKPVIPQTWHDRLRKGQKPKAKGEAEWRAQQATSDDRVTEASIQGIQGKFDKPQAQNLDILASKSQPLTPLEQLINKPTDKEPTVEVLKGTSEPGSDDLVQEKHEPPVQEQIKKPYTPPAITAEHELKPPLKVALPDKELERVTEEEETVVHYGTFTLCIDCIPVLKDTDIQCITLTELLKPAKQMVEKTHKVPYWNLLDYRQGEVFLATCAQELWEDTKPSGIVLADSTTTEWKAVGDVAIATADIIFKGN